MPMLQFAIPNAPQPFDRPDPFSRPPSTHPTPESREPSIHRATLKSPSFPIQSETPFDRRPSLGGATAGFSVDVRSQSPALSALASLAAIAPAADTHTSGESTRSSTPTQHMNQPQYAPAATAGGTPNGTGPPICQNCATSTTPLWRRDEAGSVLCNACGLFLKLHGRPRPISLKTDVIKSRNRVKTSQSKKRDGPTGPDGMPSGHPHAYPAAHPDVAHHHGLSSGMHEHQLGDQVASLHHGDPAGLGSHNPNIAPQHIFDTVSLPSDAFASPSLPSFALRQPSPSGSPLNGTSAGSLDQSQTYDALVATNNQLRTRVSELEVINDLFRGRVDELESSEREARRVANAKSEDLQRLQQQLEDANARAKELERRLVESQSEGDDEPARKRPKTRVDGVDGAGPDISS